MPNSNRNQSPPMAPHGIYPAEGDDNWIAIACRNEHDWQAFCSVVGEAWTADTRFVDLAARLKHEDELDARVAQWTRARERFATAAALQAAGVPATAVQRPEERVDHDADTAAWGLWPTAHHTEMGDVRVDGLAVHLSESDWEITHGAGCLGEHNEYVFGELLGVSPSELRLLKEEGVI
jgi:crotonobetainyl-CoA:carnitine CoA-transferase CaiB-like acyl-CoA transferase